MIGIEILKPKTVVDMSILLTSIRMTDQLDGGVRRGTDVFKAMALGASGIFIGRPVVFSLAADGEAGVRKVLQMLRDEFELTMALTGCRSLKEISRNHIVADWDPPRAVPKL